MRFSRRSTRSIFRAALPLLAIVWTSLPLHHCNLASVGSPSGATHSESLASTSSVAPPCHQLTGQTALAKATVNCSDLGKAGPDLRPAVQLDGGLAHVSFDRRWLERRLMLLSSAVASRPLDEGRWRLRPLHLRHSVLLI